ncbi:hypothetical protein [Arsukibacterium sp.]|uniref:hypothetical protein n=1 Tax=Arsukibacterium sp. TaxID=1977258 RepID=UPI002FDA9A3C
MNTNKFIYVTTAALLAGGLMLVGCERPTPTAQSDGAGLTVASEDGAGDDFNVTQAVHTAILAEPSRACKVRILKLKPEKAMFS